MVMSLSPALIRAHHISSDHHRKTLIGFRNMQQRPTPYSEPPQAEPEIYPPGSAVPRERVWISTGARHTQQIYVAKFGPVGLALLALFIGIVFVAAIFVLIGVAVISVAVGAALTIGAILTTVLRGRYRRLR
jgi:hypothetical protein